MFIILGNVARYGDLGLIAAFIFPNVVFFMGTLFKGKRDEK
jgi:hypothetical protein